MDAGIAYSHYTTTPNPPTDYHYPSSPPPGFQPQHIPPVYHAYSMPPAPNVQYHNAPPFPEHNDPELRRLAAAIEERRQAIAMTPGNMQPSPAGSQTAGTPGHERKLFPTNLFHVIALRRTNPSIIQSTHFRNPR